MGLDGVVVCLMIVLAPGPGLSTFSQYQSKGHVRSCQGQGQGQKLDNLGTTFILLFQKHFRKANLTSNEVFEDQNTFLF